MEKKKGMSLVDWVLSIGAIIVLVLLIVLPPVFRVVFEEEKPADNNTKPDVVDTTKKFDDSMHTKINCLKQENLSGYVRVRNITLAYDENTLKKWTDATVDTYLLDSKENENLFAEARLQCSNKDIYNNISGFYYSCNTLDNAVEVTKKYDLDVFNIVTLKDGDKDIIVSSEYLLNQNVEEIKLNLVNSGYTCQ